MTDCVLPLKLRPKSFSELVGQDEVIKQIQAQIGSGRIPRSWMFVGDSGAGKTTLSRIVSLALQKPDYKDFGNNLTAEDWAMWDVYDINEVNASNFNGKESMAGLVEKTRHSPLPPSRCRINLLNEAHRLTDAAQNLLLDAVETNGCTYWILVTNQPGEFIPEMHRRFSIFTLRPLNEAQILDYLSKINEQQKLGVKEIAELTKTLFASGITAPARCLQALEKVSTGAAISEALGYVTGGETEIKDLGRALLDGNGDTWKRICPILKKATTEDLVGMRYRILALLKLTILNGRGDKPRKASEMISMLTDGAPTEQAAVVPWFVSRLFLLANHSTSKV